jgi:hypothetical protein
MNTMREVRVSLHPDSHLLTIYCQMIYIVNLFYLQFSCSVNAQLYMRGLEIEQEG